MMNYFPPKSFITWGSPKKNISRLGNFTIIPINNQNNSEFYWCSSFLTEDHKYITSIWNNRDNKKSSPPFSSEEESIKWLEDYIKKISKEKIDKYNQELQEKIFSNSKYLQKLLKV